VGGLALVLPVPEDLEIALPVNVKEEQTAILIIVDSFAPRAIPCLCIPPTQDKDELMSLIRWPYFKGAAWLMMGFAVGAIGGGGGALLKDGKASFCIKSIESRKA
jgi:hypothetical protein